MPKSANPLLRRKSSSPFARPQSKQPGSRKSSLAAAGDAADRLDDTGLVPSLAPSGVGQNAVSLVKYIQSHTWEEVPDRSAGMSSERVSEVLRFRKSLPPTVSLAHLHGLSVSSTSTERELAKLIAEGKVRKLTIPGRGKGGAAAGEGVVLAEEWKNSVYEAAGLTDDMRQKYCELMDAHPASGTAPATSFTNDTLRHLVLAGYLTSPAALSTSAGSLFSSPSLSSLLPVSKAGSSAATGTIAAVGGQGAVHESGGGGSTLATKENRTSRQDRLLQQQAMCFALPGTGAYLKLLTEARLHMIHLLRQLSPRHKEATRDLLKEKWEGNVLGDAASRMKRARGEWSGVLPGKTKKWRDFYGLRFEWVLEECVGAGLVELFDTGSVGVGVRAR